MAFRWMSQDFTQWWVNFGSGNGLVPSGIKQLPEQMLTQIYVASLGHNELKLLGDKISFAVSIDFI